MFGNLKLQRSILDPLRAPFHVNSRDVEVVPIYSLCSWPESLLASLSFLFLRRIRPSSLGHRWLVLLSATATGLVKRMAFGITTFRPSFVVTTVARAWISSTFPSIPVTLMKSPS
jgi:hypothetical protein